LWSLCYISGNNDEKMKCACKHAEPVAQQRPGSSEVEELSEKDQRQASALIDAFDLALVSYLLILLRRKHRT